MKKAKASVVTQIYPKVYFAQEVLLPPPCCVAFRVIAPELSLQDLFPGHFCEGKVPVKCYRVVLGFNSFPELLLGGTLVFLEVHLIPKAE